MNLKRLLLLGLLTVGVEGAQDDQGVLIERRVSFPIAESEPANVVQVIESDSEASVGGSDSESESVSPGRQARGDYVSSAHRGRGPLAVFGMADRSARLIADQKHEKYKAFIDKQVKKGRINFENSLAKKLMVSLKEEHENLFDDGQSYKNTPYRVVTLQESTVKKYLRQLIDAVLQNYLRSENANHIRQAIATAGISENMEVVEEVAKVPYKYYPVDLDDKFVSKYPKTTELFVKQLEEAFRVSLLKHPKRSNGYQTCANVVALKQ